MLTRLEVNGFKNLMGFSVDFGPFNCIAGPNGVGKSNIFDAIRFLSLLADHTLQEAALRVRDADPETSDLYDLFWTDGSRRLDSFQIAAEMIVAQDIVDDFGRPARASSSFLRYEIEIGYTKPSSESLERLVLRKETLNYITQGDAVKQLRFPNSAKHFRNMVVQNRRRAEGYIVTQSGTDGQIEILIRQEGNQGRPQRAPAMSAMKTIVGTSNTSTTPTILAARREMQSWRLLALEPSAMRRADRLYDDPHVSANGDHLPATLFRLAKQDENVYARVTNRLSQLLNVRQVNVNHDPVRQLLTLEAQEKSGAYLPARSLSDGTLRFLTLCILVEDSEAQGVICMEEPENGIHPEKMPDMVNLLRDLAVDAHQPVGTDNPLRQVIVATHSPVFVMLQKPDDLLFAALTRVRTDLGPASTLRCRPLNNTWRCDAEESGVAQGTILAYLTTPPGQQVKLPMELTG